MKAKVIALNQRGGKDAPTSINEAQVKIGDVVDVDENTLKNLAKKGILEAADADAKKVDLGAPSILSEAKAKEQIKEAVDNREATKRAADAAAAKRR